jgi:hypothetical protein
MAGNTHNDTNNKAANEDGTTTIKPPVSFPVTYFSSLAAQFDVTQTFNDSVAGANLAQVASIQVSFTLDVDSVVLIGYVGSIYVGTGRNLALGYQINSDDAVVCNYTSRTAVNADVNNGCFTCPVALPAGSHTIKLMAGRSGTAGVTIMMYNPNYHNHKFYATVLGPEA